MNLSANEDSVIGQILIEIARLNRELELLKKSSLNTKRKFIETRGYMYCIDDQGDAWLATGSSWTKMPPLPEDKDAL